LTDPDINCGTGASRSRRISATGEVLAAGECAVRNIVVLDAHKRAHDLGVFKARWA
jgi:hypothetical protein